MNEAKLIFVTLIFFPAYAQKLQCQRFSAVMVGIEETLEWFQWECNLQPSGSLSLDKRFVYGKESILVWFKVRDICVHIQSPFGSRQKGACLPK